jgi:hypothetical protein
LRGGALALGLVLWPAAALACPTCAQDRGVAVYLIGAISLLPLLLAATVGLYAWRMARAEGRGA